MPCTRYRGFSSLAASSSNTRMNSVPMILRLASGSVTPFRRSRKRSSRVHGHQRHLERVAEGLHHLLALVLAHQPVVHEHAGELVADRAVHEQRGHRGVDPAGQPADHLAVAHLLADAADLLLGHGRGVPAHVAAADVLEEAGEDLRAVGRVHHLGVELDPVEAALGVLEGRDRRLGGRRQRRGARRRLVDGVAVAHPAALLVGQPLEQPAVLGDGELERPNSPTSAPSTRPPSSSTITCMP